MIKRTIYLLLGIAAAVFVPYLVGRLVQNLQIVYNLSDFPKNMALFITWCLGLLFMCFASIPPLFGYVIYQYIKYGD